MFAIFRAASVSSRKALVETKRSEVGVSTAALARAEESRPARLAAEVDVPMDLAAAPGLEGAGSSSLESKNKQSSNLAGS